VRPFVGAVGPVRNGVVPGSRSGVEIAIGASAITASGPIGRERIQRVYSMRVKECPNRFPSLSLRLSFDPCVVVPGVSLGLL
jgi:hypothetical protein